MKTLPIRFTNRAYEYSQVKRNDTHAVYAQSYQGRVIAYEAIEIVMQKDREIAGRKLQGGEAYPGSEQWGSKGWTFPTLEKALNRVKLA